MPSKRTHLRLEEVRLTALTHPERPAGVKVPILGSRTNNEGTLGYIWCRKMPSCSEGVTWPCRAINAPNGCSNMEAGIHLEPSCLADGTRPGSPDHLLDSHKQELLPVNNKYRDNRKSKFSGPQAVCVWSSWSPKQP